MVIKIFDFTRKYQRKMLGLDTDFYILENHIKLTKDVKLRNKLLHRFGIIKRKVIGETK